MKKIILLYLGIALATCVELLIPIFLVKGHSQIFASQAIPGNQTLSNWKSSQASNLNLKAQVLRVEVAPEVRNRLVAANNEFSFKLFSEIHKQQSGQNIFISPYSVAISLAMVYNGASGETQRAMAETLVLQGISLEEVNQAHEALKASLINSDSEVQFAIANSLWSNKDISFNPEFFQRVQKAYTAQVEAVNFSNPGLSSLINDWVKQNTNGKIDQIVDEIDPNSALLLFNAIYFKGKWEIPFPKEATKALSFNLLNGGQKQLDMMSSRQENYPYYENELFQAVSLPYKNGRLSMYIFLPKKEVSLAAFYKKLNTETWQQWMSEFKSKEGFIQLPRFKLDYEITLNDALKALGMEIAFDKKLADFSEMQLPNANPSANKFSIDLVKQKTFVEVNEEGTEAAAVTGTMMLMSLQLDTFSMIVDRPFFCAIGDNQTGTILFMGSIVEPK
jgi:serine protease inhibitor